ncbi:MAG: hypothetical protein CM1200mP41_00280 [Gammaproteobacteria bacterium]|nr:MAG: hypothetical protein CM1200mP41_00280 [Gammaproteobacteria bacterium]
MLTAIFAIGLYLAVLVLVGGTAFRLVHYERIPVPLVIPTTPAPITRTGVVARLFRESFSSRVCFKRE